MARLILLLLFIINLNFAKAQKKQLSANEIVNNYLEAIGGREKWETLQSRVEDGFVFYPIEEGSSSLITKDETRKRYDLSPGYHLEKKNSFLNETTIMSYKSDCNWFYSEKISTLHFFGLEPAKMATDYPRTEALEALNLKMIRKVEEDSLCYKIDFKDIRQANGIQTLYFDKETFLLSKRTFLSKTDVLWEYTFEDYRIKDGFKEPYTIYFKANDDLFLTYKIDEIVYNSTLAQKMFEPPVPCRNFPSSEVLDVPFFFNY